MVHHKRRLGSRWRGLAVERQFSVTQTASCFAPRHHLPLLFGQRQTLTRNNDPTPKAYRTRISADLVPDRYQGAAHWQTNAANFLPLPEHSTHEAVHHDAPNRVAQTAARMPLLRVARARCGEQLCALRRLAGCSSAKRTRRNAVTQGHRMQVGFTVARSTAMPVHHHSTHRRTWASFFHRLSGSGHRCLCVTQMSLRSRIGRKARVTPSESGPCLGRV